MADVWLDGDHDGVNFFLVAKDRVGVDQGLVLLFFFALFQDVGLGLLDVRLFALFAEAGPLCYVELLFDVLGLFPVHKSPNTMLLNGINLSWPRRQRAKIAVFWVRAAEVEVKLGLLLFSCLFLGESLDVDF